MFSLKLLASLSLLSLSLGAPLRREVPSVPDAVIAFAPSGSLFSEVEVGQPISANDDVVPSRGALVLAAGEGNGHWLTYTTSTWVEDQPATSTEIALVATDTSGPISSFVSSSAGVEIGVTACVGLGSDCSGSTSTSSSDSVTSLTSDSITAYPTSDALAPSPIPTDATASSEPSGVTVTAITDSLSSPPISVTSSSAASQPTTGTGNGTSGGNYNSAKHVFAHFMVGIVSTYQTADWVADMQLAKFKGITGFALNIGVDPYSQSQLDLAYDAATQVGDFNVFISFDFNWYTVDNVTGVSDMMKRYMDKPSQLLVDGKPFVSSFIGDGFDWSAVANQIGRPIYAMPFFQPSADSVNNPGVSGLFSWAAWPGQLDNQPVLAAMTLNRDEQYMSQLSAAGKQYMAPISPWFFTHFGTEVSYSKNWLFYSEDLWKTRWDQVLQLGQQGVNFVEIVTWNDYGEAHHVGPFNTPHTDDGSSKWAEGLDHSAMLDFSVPYIEAFKQGKSEPVIDKEMLVYWHRPHIKDVSCDSTDNCGSKPTGWEYVEDVLFVATMTKSGGSVTVNSGGNAPVTKTVDAGVQIFNVPMGIGAQSFDFRSTAGVSASGTSNVTVSDTCWNGIYNYNFHSGVVA